MDIEIFDIHSKRDDQAKWVAQLSPQERFLLTLELMNVSIGLMQGDRLQQKPDNFDWIELKNNHETKKKQL
jgi:hypothetical protein